MEKTAPDYEFDLAISYAGEDEEVASALKRKLDQLGVETFFAPHRRASRLGEPMDLVFMEVYARKTRLVAVLVSDHYPGKHWPMFELAKALEEEERRGERLVIPLLLSDANIELLPPNRFPLDLRKVGVEEAAVHDPRSEVRSVVINAVVKFRLEDLAPELMQVYKKQRSRKGKNDIETALRLFNHRSDVVDFGKEMGLGPAFFRPPPYIHDWEKSREGWL